MESTNDPAPKATTGIHGQDLPLLLTAMTSAIYRTRLSHGSGSSETTRELKESSERLARAALASINPLYQEQQAALNNVRKVLDYMRDDAPDLITIEGRAMFRAALDGNS